MISLFHPNQLISYQELSARSMPGFLRDLGMEPVLSEIVNQYGREDIKPYFYYLSDGYDTTKFRQDIFRELRTPAVRAIVTDFVNSVHEAEQFKANYEAMAPHAPQKWKWLLDSIITYYSAMERLCIRFNECTPKAVGLYYMHRFFYDILNVEEIKKLRMKAFNLKDEFDKMNFRITLNKDRATFSIIRDESDYTSQLRAAYTHGKGGKSPHYFEEKVFPEKELSPLEEYVTEMFRNKNRLLFRDMETFLAINREVISEDVLEIVRELEFYLAVTKFADTMKRKGFPFFMPRLSKDKEIDIRDCFDVSLAIHMENAESIVLNDIQKSNYEKAILVIGPEKSGKTTIGRAFGQCFYFGMMGFSVPARLARLPYVFQIVTAFGMGNTNKENAERALRSELMMVHKAFSEMNDTRFVVVANELFQDAPTVDALAMNRDLMEQMLKRHGIVFYITDTPEMGINRPEYVTLQSTVIGDGSNRRTYRIIRKNPEELSYTDSIVDKYKLNYSHIDFRIKNNSEENDD